MNGPTQGGALSPDGRKLATLAEDARRLTVTDLESGRVMSRVVDGPIGSGLFWSPRGSYLLAHALVGFILLDARSLATVFSLDAGNEIIVEDLKNHEIQLLLERGDRGELDLRADSRGPRRLRRNKMDLASAAAYI